MTNEAEFPGDVDHPDHDDFLLELGRATYAAAAVAGIAFDVLRVHSGIASSDLYSDPLGALEKKLRASPPPLKGVDDFLNLLGLARQNRNDLLHALPVKYGLHRRRRDDPFYVRDFFTVESLREVRAALEKASRMGGDVLYADGGAAVRRWYGQDG